MAEKAGGLDGAALGVCRDGDEEASPDGEEEPSPDGGDTEGGPEVGAGSATTPEPAPPHAVTAADAQARARTPRWRSFRISDIRQGKAIAAALVTQL
ncbi:hypothetical protein GCM10022226_02530 [Sphaerisporangium flaviroseum]|uniref:Uncharacterized protein n=1 Tax=Sphaerisporangium flaviroseum TaxID=509199 RepID=A0ABP7H7P9_9ACTN